LPGELLIRVHATTIIRDELKWEENARNFPIPGHDVSGIIQEVHHSESDGSESTTSRNFKPGDPIFALTSFLRDGAFAEYTIALPSEVAHKPRGIDFREAASIPLSALTAYQALFKPAHGRLKFEENGNVGAKVLITGAAGGVGVYAVQLAKWAGARVVGTASLEESERLLTDLGIDEVVNYKQGRFEEKVNDVDVVLDTVGGETLGRTWGCVKEGGRVVAVATDSPDWALGKGDSQAARERREKYPGVSAVYFVVKPNGEQLAKIGELVEQGKVRPVVQKVVGLRQAMESYRDAQEGGVKGKIVLKIRDDE
jgi:NADPH:quinone reductase-like Zn-dependent oxidoreductase